jgi:putative intracellular protease/amidase
MVIANRDFYYREYAVPRAELMAAGLQVRVAAQTTQLSYPHPASGQGQTSGAVRPDLALSQVRSEDYSAIVFVGGWGSSAYQYAPPGVYTNAIYNGTPELKATTNRLIGEFMAQDKYVTAICHGVSVLAWARVNGVSPLAGRRATGGPFLPPMINGPQQYSTSWYLSANQALVVPSRSIGNIHSAADDVIVDGRIIVAEDYDSADLFGQTLARHLQNP